MTYYTLQIHYFSDPSSKSTNTTVEEWKDLEPGGMDFNAWAKNLRHSLFNTGFNKRVSPTTVAFISPFRIVTVLLIEQDKKYGV